MLIDIKVPILSESISEATLVSWHKKIGDYVNQDENLVDLETDKVVLEIVAPKAGVLVEVTKADGSSVKSDELIAVIDTEASATAVATPGRPLQIVESAISEKTATMQNNSQQISSDNVRSFTRETIIDHTFSPAVRKIVAEYGLDPTQISGSGKDGRITKADVLQYLEEKQQEAVIDSEVAEMGSNITPISQASSAPSSISAPVELEMPPPAASFQPVKTVGRPEKRVKMSRLRARVAVRLKEAQNTAAILTTFNEVNMKPVMDLRAKYKNIFLQKYGHKLGLMSFFTFAAVNALKQYPIINASVDGEDIVYHGYYDIGIAVGSPRGLVVPILRDVDKMSFADIEAAIVIYNEKAKTGKLTIEDLTGGTFSISNGGVYGSMLSTPILNPPQSAILGMHNIVERPVVENGEIVVRPVMYLALSYDHRIVDGHDAVLFLVAIKEAIEDPARLLLKV